MIDYPVTLTPSGGVVLPGHAAALMLGYTKNKGVYRLRITASGEWQGLTIRCCWHVPGGDDPASTLVVDGCADVPASVTALAGGGCITFEGSDGTKTVTSADLRYRVGANSGTEDGTEPERGTPAWQQLVDAVHAAGTPVQVCYKLTTPTPFTAKGAQPIPALSGTNTVITDVDSVTVTGRAGPIKRITDLEDAVASMT